jgi:serine protease Do
MQGGPSEKAGLKRGDLIVEVDGQTIRNTRELIDYIAFQPPDAKVDLEILRGKKKIHKQVALGQRPLVGGAVPVVEEEADEEGSIEWLGLEYRDLNSELRAERSLPEGAVGVWISDVALQSPLYDKNVRPGHVIVDVNGQAISSAADFEAAVQQAKEGGGYIRFYVRQYGRDGNSNAFFVAIEIP